jgi:hypothetical protein
VPQMLDLTQVTSASAIALHRGPLLVSHSVADWPLTGEMYGRSRRCYRLRPSGGSRRYGRSPGVLAPCAEVNARAHSRRSRIGRQRIHCEA